MYSGSGSEMMWFVAAEECVDDPVPSAGREVVVVVTMLSVAVLVGAGWSLSFHLGNAHNGALWPRSFTAVGLYILRMRPRSP